MEMTFLETEAGRVGYVFSIGLFVAIVSQMGFALPTYGMCRSRWIENAEEPRLYSCKLRYLQISVAVQMRVREQPRSALDSQCGCRSIFKVPGYPQVGFLPCLCYSYARDYKINPGLTGWLRAA